MTSPARRQRIQELLDEGRTAFGEGKTAHQNPYMGTPDGLHWYNGHAQAAVDFEAAVQDNQARAVADEATLARFAVISALKEYVDSPTEFAIKRLDERMKDWEDSIINRSRV